MTLIEIINGSTHSATIRAGTRFKECDYSEWLAGIQSGYIGIQSGNYSNFYIHSKNQDRITRIKYRKQPFEHSSDTVAFFNNYYSSPVHRDHTHFYIFDPKNIVSTSLRKYITTKTRLLLNPLQQLF
jgi:hypothetical protein